jgi:hypothetical protein
MSATGATVLGGIFIFLIILWTLSGLAALIMSMMCFGYKGSTGDKTIGLLLALVLGPFYWFFYAFNSAYCLSNDSI